MPNVKDVHVDAALTNFAVGYSVNRPGLIAEKVMPVLNVKKESDKYFTWNRGDAFRTTGRTSLRADGAESRTIGTSVTTSTYQMEEYALKTRVTKRELENADSALNLRMSKTRLVVDQLLLDQETRVASLLQTSSNYADSNTGTPGTKWDQSSPTIEADLDDAKAAVRQQMGYEPNVLIIPDSVAKVIKRNSSIRELIKYTQSDLLVNGDLPPTLFNMEVVIPMGIKNTATEGNTDNFDNIWTDSVVLAYRNPTPSTDSPTFGVIFRKANSMTVESWDERKKKAEFIEASMMQDEKITSNVSGYLLTNVLANVS